MNSDSKPISSVSPPQRSWGWIVGVSAGVSVCALIAGTYVLVDPLRLLAVFFCVGALAGMLATRQAWLAGIIVGLPLGLQQLTRYSLQEFKTLSEALGRADYWRIVPPVSIVATGVAVLGAMSGAWLLGARFRPR